VSRPDYGVVIERILKFSNEPLLLRKIATPDCPSEADCKAAEPIAVELIGILLSHGERLPAN
jgi:hypothetical protein